MSLFWSRTYALAILINYCIAVYGQNQTTTTKNVKRTQTEIKVSIVNEKAKPDTKRVEPTTITTPKSTTTNVITETTAKVEDIEDEAEKEEHQLTKSPDRGFFETALLPIRKFIFAFLSADKVQAVLRNIAICIINGGMDLAAYYFPAPLLPMFATMISYLVPIEPVVTLRRKLPVSSYRKAINTAMNSFLKTFDRYKIVVDDESYDDPYMTQRFNRRFNIDSDEVTKKVASTKTAKTTKKS